MERRQECYYTYEQWLDLDIEGRSELIGGQLYMMADPTSRHQKVVAELLRQIANFLLGKTCQVFPSPFGVRLNETRDTAYEPDLVVICDPSKIKHRGCVGAPDMVIEVLSPSTAQRDKVDKYYDYMQAGVKEYWIVDGENNFLDAYRLVDGKYVQQTYFEKDNAPIQVLQGCEIDLSLVFEKLILS